MAIVGGVFEVAEADAHVVVDVVGDGDGEAHAEGSVGEGERVEVAIAQEEEAGTGAPDEGKRHQDRIRDVGCGEENRCEGDGGSACHAEAEESKQDEDLQDELLHQRPERVAEDVNGDGERSVERVQGAQVFGERDSGDEEDDRGGWDPEGRQEAAQAEAVGRGFFTAEDRSDGDPHEGGPVEDSLGGVRGPDGGEDQAVADGEFE